MRTPTKAAAPGALNPPSDRWGMPDGISLVLAGVFTVLPAGCATAATPAATPTPTRTRSLQSNTFPTGRFEARQTHGLPRPLPTQGEHSFQIEGDMTVREVTRPLAWEVTARFEEEMVSGQSRTGFTFDGFQITQPSVSIVLSVDDEIRLELDFTGRLARESGP